MNYTHFASPSVSTPLASHDNHSAIAEHRGDVTTVQAANYVRLQKTKRIDQIQSHAPSYRTARTTSLSYSPKDETISSSQAR